MKIQDKNNLVSDLLKISKKEFEQQRGSVSYNGTPNKKANQLIGDLKKHPHAFVLACIMDRQINGDRAFGIPYKFSQILGSFEFKRLLKLTPHQIEKIFTDNNLHRFNKIMAKNFYSGIQRIHNQYNDNAVNIWNEKPGSATVVKRFLEFDGAGIKIATMAANILARELKVSFKDYYSVDISADVHVKRVFRRIGLINEDASIEELIYTARELNPKYPGILDLSAWKIGRYWCRPKNPICQKCALNKSCPKII